MGTRYGRREIPLRRKAGVHEREVQVGVMVKERSIAEPVDQFDAIGSGQDG
jgi:hypothetical protein